jgi:hypothetical protein
MPYTMEDFKRDYVKEHLKKLTPVERLEGLSPKVLLKSLSPEVAKGLLKKLKAEHKSPPRKPRRRK